jgi:hypothetical protein
MSVIDRWFAFAERVYAPWIRIEKRIVKSTWLLSSLCVIVAALLAFVWLKYGPYQ